MAKRKTLWARADDFARKQNPKLGGLVARKGRFMNVGEMDITHEYLRFAFMKGYECRRITQQRS